MIRFSSVRVIPNRNEPKHIENAWSFSETIETQRRKKSPDSFSSSIVSLFSFTCYCFFFLTHNLPSNQHLLYQLLLHLLAVSLPPFAVIRRRRAGRHCRRNGVVGSVHWVIVRLCRTLVRGLQPGQAAPRNDTWGQRFPPLQVLVSWPPHVHGQGLASFCPRILLAAAVGILFIFFFVNYGSSKWIVGIFWGVFIE